jgi:hypothetical protein
VRRDRSVLVSPWARTDLQTAVRGGTGGLAAWSPVEVGVGPLQGAGFFGAEPGQQAERDVGVHHGGDWFVGGQEQSGVLGAELGQVGHGR